MNKFEIARVLDEISNYVELSESNRFKSLAFEKASRAISALERDPADMLASGERLTDVDEVENAEVSGSVRRRLETIRNVNIVVATRDPQRVTKALAKIVADTEVLD